ncbi:HAD family hydrolase [Motiliproteus sp. MSK22-1]|uniref:HAD family hydrolase n=1 Tax=Motiliproteus sp. MSK22-1 TaxID=1897630 RepID=UPI0009FAD127|nr:HAD family hydrolase [Motiliproteus sp. MSK22-1]
MIRIITFDLDDTLWDVSEVMVKANQALYQWLHRHAPEFTARYQIEDFDRLREQIVQEHPEWAHSVTAIRLGVLRKGLSASGYHGDSLEELIKQAFACLLKARNQVTFFQHAIEMIQELHPHYQLGALSNGNADIEQVGLGDFFDFGLNADQVGTAKPDPLMFNQMLELTGAKPNQVIHVGDHPEHDVQGAQRAGLYSLWVNLNNAAWPGGEPPTLEVQCLSEIPAAISAFSSNLSR